jgi:hypothetical protein
MVASAAIPAEIRKAASGQGIFQVALQKKAVED